MWPLLAVAFALLSTLWILVPAWRLLLHPQVLLLTIPFLLVDLFLEEGYWRRTHYTGAITQAGG